MKTKTLTLIAGIFLTAASISNLWYELWNVCGLGIGISLVYVGYQEFKTKT